jgi:hypothetical protein
MIFSAASMADMSPAIDPTPDARLQGIEPVDLDGVQLLVLNRGAPAQGAVASLPVVEDL